MHDFETGLHTYVWGPIFCPDCDLFHGLGTCSCGGKVIRMCVCGMDMVWINGAGVCLDCDRVREMTSCHRTLPST